MVCGHTHTHTHTHTHIYDINSKNRVIKVGKCKMNDLPWAQGFLSIISKHALHPISESKAPSLRILGYKINNKTASMLKKLRVWGGRPTCPQMAAVYSVDVGTVRGLQGVLREHKDGGKEESLPALGLGATPRAVGVLALLCRRIMEINWALSTLVQNVT